MLFFTLQTPNCAVNYLNYFSSCFSLNLTNLSFLFLLFPFFLFFSFHCDPIHNVLIRNNNFFCDLLFPVFPLHSFIVLFVRWWHSGLLLLFVTWLKHKIKENNPKTQSQHFSERTKQIRDMKTKYKKKNYFNQSNFILLTVHCVISYFLLCCIVGYIWIKLRITTAMHDWLLTKQKRKKNTRKNNCVQKIIQKLNLESNEYT